MKDIQSKQFEIFKPTEVNSRYFYFILLAPILMPFITASAFIICLAVGGIIGATIGGISSSSGGFPGAIIGLIIGGFLGIEGAKIAYIFAPFFIYTIIIFCYFTVSFLQEITGKKFIADINGIKLDIKVMTLISLLSVGIFSLAIFYLINYWFGIFDKELAHSTTSLESTIDFHFSIFLESTNQIASQIVRFGYTGLIASILCFLWMTMIYIGGNYYLTRSIRYCIQVFVTAFFLDSIFTITCYVYYYSDIYTIAGSGYYFLQDSPKKLIQLQP